MKVKNYLGVHPERILTEVFDDNDNLIKTMEAQINRGGGLVRDANGNKYEVTIINIIEHGHSIKEDGTRIKLIGTSQYRFVNDSLRYVCDDSVQWLHCPDILGKVYLYKGYNEIENPETEIMRLLNMGVYDFIYRYYEMFKNNKERRIVEFESNDKAYTLFRLLEVDSYLYSFLKSRRGKRK